MKFDYMRSAHPAIVEALLEFKLPQWLRAPLFAIVFAVSIATAAWAIEGYRYAIAASADAISLAQLQETRLELSRSKVGIMSLRRLEALVRRVDSIQASGTTLAARFAAIGNRLPPHVWLVSVTEDESGLVLTGRAVTFEGLGNSIERLAGVPVHYHPWLMRAQRDAKRTGFLQYELRLANAH